MSYFSKKKLFRSIEFNDVRPQLKLRTLDNSSNQSFAANQRSVTDRLTCSGICTNIPECRSYHYVHTNYAFVCEFFIQDAFSVNATLEPNEAYTYVGMKRETYPNCTENGLKKDITNDTNPHNCDINLKRIDTVCSDWNYATVKNKSDWMNYREQHCFEGSHQDLRNNSKKTVLQYFDWLKFVHDKLTAYEAINNCRALGGQLFGDFNGTQEQIWFLAQQFHFYSFWVGFNDIEKNGDWRNLKGKNSSLLPWMSGQPTNYRDESFTIALPQFLSDENPKNIIGTCFSLFKKF